MLAPERLAEMREAARVARAFDAGGTIVRRIDLLCSPGRRIGRANGRT